MIITIDGPGASGKSVIAQKLAERLNNGYRCLNTGAMYRAVGWRALHECPNLDDEECISGVAARVHLDFDWNAAPPTLLMDGRSIEAEIHGEAIANAASRVARIKAVRGILVEQQARIGRQMPDLVSEGRDQGSIVFPEARFKFFLTADVSIRAKRRYDQLVRKGKEADEQDVLQDLIRRDHQDTSSEVGRLVVPTDAHIIDTTDIHSVDDVADKMHRIIQEQLQHG